MHEIADKKQAIIEATLKLITENGFHATPMSLIAKEAQVAAGTIYHYFENKEVLIQELYALLKEKMGKALIVSDSPNLTFKERFWLFWKNIYQHFIENPEQFKFLEQYASSPLINKNIKEENEKHYRPVVDFLETGIKIGVFRKMNPELMLALVYGNVAATVKLHLSGTLTINKTLLEQAIQASWDGVRIN